MGGEQTCTLMSKQVIAKGSEFPVMYFRFECEGSEPMGVDPGVGQSLKLFNESWTGRKYSPVEVRDGGFSLGVKIYEGGKMSEYLKKAEIGTKMWWRSKAGTKVRTPGGDNIGMIAMGIGITAVLPVLERELTTQADSKITLLYANRAPVDEIWMPRIASLAASYPDRFTYTRHLTRHPPQPDDAAQCISHDRLTADVLNGYFHKWDKESARFLVVGSKQQKKSIFKALEEIGFDTEATRLHEKGEKKRKRSWCC